MSKSNNTDDQEPGRELAEELGLDDSFFQGPVTHAHRILFAKLRRMVGKEYEDPYKDGPEKMAKYFDSFLQFFRDEYPNENNHKGTLKSLIPKLSKIKLPDDTVICVSYSMDNQESDYEFSNADSSVEKITDRHIQIAQMFKGNVQEGIFSTVTMMVDAMPKDARDKMEKAYLAKARGTEPEEK